MNHLNSIRNINAARNLNKDGTPKRNPETFLGDTATTLPGLPPTAGHSAAQGGLRGHSIGAAYPYSVVLRIEDGKTVYDVVNLLVGGKPLATYRSSDKAHAKAEELGTARRARNAGEVK